MNRKVIIFLYISYSHKEDDPDGYPIAKHPTDILEKSRRRHLVDAVTAAVAAAKTDVKSQSKDGIKGKRS